MAGRSITIELSDDEYRRLEALAKRSGLTPGDALHRLIEVSTEGDDGVEEFLAAMEDLRRSIHPPYTAEEFQQLLDEAAKERDGFAGS